MANRPRSRALRPSPEGLESRKLLSKTITGTDVDGDQWTLHLEGPGDFRVLLQPDAAGNPVEPPSPGLIDQINIAGASPTRTDLFGRVRKAAGGDGRVFFQSLTEQGGASPNVPGRLGIRAIDIPDFWLGRTSTATGTAVGATGISIPDGVNTLRFGGIDVNFTPPGGTPLNANGTADNFPVTLGVPRSAGTSIIVNQVVTNAQAASTATGTPTQDAATFTVAGRLNLFQANKIVGNPAFPSTGFAGGGGTVVTSETDTPTTLTGQIGFIRVGGDATNFAAQTDSQIANFYIGGETNNVHALAPTGMRNVSFGRGMDTVTIRTNTIDTLAANRGALSSDVTVNRRINKVALGGDVVNTRILAGYAQDLATIFRSQTEPTTTPRAQDGGELRDVRIGGNITDSVFAASVEPGPEGTFGTPQDLLLPHGGITARVQGTINNAATTPDQPGQAFFAHRVRVTRGPVGSPNVPEPPFVRTGLAPAGPRITGDLMHNLAQQAATTTATTASAASVHRHKRHSHS